MTDFAPLVSSTMMRPRDGGSAIASVSFDPKIRGVEFKVYETKLGTSASGAMFMSGELGDKPADASHSFVFPVTKGMVYFMLITVDDGGERGHLTWLFNPFKRKQGAATLPKPADAAPPASVEA